MAFDMHGKAPGKILWIGGYSVLERPNVSLVSTVDAYVTAHVKSTEGNSLVMESPNFKEPINGTINISTGEISANVPDELRLMKTAIEVASRYVASLGMPLTGMHISTSNDPALSYSISNGKVVKSGLGSSAAVTVALVGSILSAYGVDASEKDALHKLSQLAHSTATGKVGSGFDIAAATYGTIVYTRYSPGIVKDFPSTYTNEELKSLVDREWDYTIEKFEMPKSFGLSFAKFVGEGMVTTSAIGSVSGFKTKNPQEYKKLIGEINDQNVRAIKALKGINEGKLGAPEEFRDAFDKGRLLSKRLGVLSAVDIEPEDCTRLIDESKKHGAFVAKLPGAGGKDAISAISIGQDSQMALRGFWSSNSSLNVMQLNYTSEGFYLEKTRRPRKLRS